MDYTIYILSFLSLLFLGLVTIDRYFTKEKSKRMFGYRQHIVLMLLSILCSINVIILSTQI